ncbi:MAG: hypothetical protein JHC88_07655 [Niveispirillum sp.]|nr:hypothetical protein [Niveispirillum sp.]
MINPHPLPSVPSPAFRVSTGKGRANKNFVCFQSIGHLARLFGNEQCPISDRAQPKDGHWTNYHFLGRHMWLTSMGKSLTPLTPVFSTNEGRRAKSRPKAGTEDGANVGQSAGIFAQHDINAANPYG